MKKFYITLFLVVLSATAVFADNIIPIKVNPPCELSYKSKQYVYNLRKNYVQKSIFSNPNYKPSDEVFGGIVGGKPWIANTYCYNRSAHKAQVNGYSEESRYINNPTVLVALEFRWLFGLDNPSEEYICKTDSVTMLLPKSVVYNKTKNEIIVTYAKLPFSSNIYGKDCSFLLNGVNANDLGYKYAYVDNSLSTYKLNFVNSNNISTNIYRFRDYIHLGGSCRVPGGCNNSSPNQPELMFRSPKTAYNNSGKYIYIKLWKQKPASSKAKPDIVEKIVLEKS